MTQHKHTTLNSFNTEMHSFIGYLRFVHIILIKIPPCKNRKANINLSDVSDGNDGGGVVVVVDSNDDNKDDDDCTYLHLFATNS